jgi:hypothetical protein
MLREVGLPQPEFVFQVADASVAAVAERHHDAQPDGMSQGFEDLRLHGGRLHRGSRPIGYSVFRISASASSRQ